MYIRYGKEKQKFRSGQPAWRAGGKLLRENFKEYGKILNDH
jgi:hypothetical protein